MIENLFLHSTRTIRAIALACTQLQCNQIGRYTNYVWMYSRTQLYFLPFEKTEEEEEEEVNFNSTV